MVEPKQPSCQPSSYSHRSSQSLLKRVSISIFRGLFVDVPFAAFFAISSCTGSSSASTYCSAQSLKFAIFEGSRTAKEAGSDCLKGLNFSSIYAARCIGFLLLMSSGAWIPNLTNGRGGVGPQLVINNSCRRYRPQSPAAVKTVIAGGEPRYDPEL